MSTEFPLSGMTQAEAYVLLAKWGVAQCTSARSLRSNWVSEGRRREEYSLSEAQIAELLQAYKDQVAIIEEGAIPEQPEKKSRRPPPKQRQLI